jgi:cytochrome P450
MAIYHIHYNETLFENPRVFDPERWLQGPEVTAERAKFLVPFSRGSRSCLGIKYVLAFEKDILLTDV